MQAEIHSKRRSEKWMDGCVGELERRAGMKNARNL
jgi:hypothetical protein